MGAFASIYHPVGIPMLVQGAKNPGFTIGVNGLAGNLGIAGAAMLTGFPVKLVGWRAAFAGPALIALACGLLFALVVPREEMAPAKRARKQLELPRRVMVRVFLVMTLAAISGSLIFNFTTNGNGRLLAERLGGLVDDPASLGILLAVVYTMASFAQLVVGKLIDRYPLKWVYLPDGRPPGAAVPARRPSQRLGALRHRAPVHGLRLRRDPVRRRHDRAVRGRPDALARVGHAAGRVVRGQLARGLRCWGRR